MLGNSGLNPSLVSDYSLSARDLFQAMTVAPDNTRKRAINNLISGLKKEGIWDELDVFYMLAAHDRQAAKLNWKYPSLYTITEPVAPTFTTDRGFQGNGSTQYLNTNYNPFTNGIKYTLNNASSGLWSLTNVAANSIDMGLNDNLVNGAVQISPRLVAGNFGGRIFSGGLAITNSDSRGLFSLKRPNGLVVSQYVNGVEVNPNVSAAANAGTAHGSVYILANNTGSSTSNYSTRQIAFSYLGSGSINHTALYNLVQTYLKAVGAV